MNIDRHIGRVLQAEPKARLTRKPHTFNLPTRHNRILADSSRRRCRKSLRCRRHRLHRNSTSLRLHRRCSASSTKLRRDLYVRPQRRHLPTKLHKSCQRTLQQTPRRLQRIIPKVLSEQFQLRETCHHHYQRPPRLRRPPPRHKFLLLTQLRPPKKCRH